MAVTTVFVLFPFALVGAVLYSRLLIGKLNFFQLIETLLWRKVLITVTYIFSIIILTLVLVFISFALLMGIIGFPLLIALDIVGIVLVRKKKREA
ncbi:hypothetical protein [Sediminispirochaeta bajacaliforniensis]|uniref:hypothetical protein n=1 Tax=Sediminispirochaeta bajacaliforniensis TaxID=148 RepID=UPI000373BE0E|nr:hypothetical protein [Sediminispirochaeta bajacaliforniensis]